MSQKLIEVHFRDKNINQLAKLFGTDYDDCSGWIEEFLNEDELNLDFKDYSELEEQLDEDDLKSLSQKLIEHYRKEISMNIGDIINLINNVKITLKS